MSYVTVRIDPDHSQPTLTQASYAKKECPMHSIITNWPAVVLRGVLALLLGMFAYFAQGFFGFEVFEIISVSFIIFALCAYGVLDGLLLLWFAAESPRGILQKASFTQGIGSVAIGLALATAYFLSTSAWSFVILGAGQCWLMGLTEFYVAFHLRRHKYDRHGFAVLGATAILFGLLTFALADGTGRQAAIWLTWYGAGMAATHFWIALRIRSWRKDLHHSAAAA